MLRTSRPCTCARTAPCRRGRAKAARTKKHLQKPNSCCVTWTCTGSRKCSVTLTRATKLYSLQQPPGDLYNIYWIEVQFWLEAKKKDQNCTWLFSAWPDKQPQLMLSTGFLQPNEQRLFSILGQSHANTSYFLITWKQLNRVHATHKQRN